MQFRFRDAPEWFHDHFLKYYVDELHSIKKSQQTVFDNDLLFKRIAVEFFTNKGFTVWLDENNHIWFDVDPDSAKWTFEILRT